MTRKAPKCQILVFDPKSDLLMLNQCAMIGYRRPFENFGQSWDPKIGQKTSNRGSLIEISAEMIILGIIIIHRLVRNFDWGPSGRGFLAYFRIPILTKIFEWTIVTKKVNN